MQANYYVKIGALSGKTGHFELFIDHLWGLIIMRLNYVKKEQKQRIKSSAYMLD